MTSKPDNPPPYVDALHHPKYDNCPQQSPPPPPSYSAIPGTFPSPPGYWLQAGTWAGPAFSPSGVPATVPTLSAGVPAANTGWEEKRQDSIAAHWSPMFELVGISQLCRRHGGCSAQPVGEHICSPRLHQKGKDFQPSTQWLDCVLCPVAEFYTPQKTFLSVPPRQHLQRFCVISYSLPLFCFVCRFIWFWLRSLQSLSQSSPYSHLCKCSCIEVSIVQRSVVSLMTQEGQMSHVIPHVCLFTEIQCDSLSSDTPASTGLLCELQQMSMMTNIKNYRGNNET